MRHKLVRTILLCLTASLLGTQDSYSSQCITKQPEVEKPWAKMWRSNATLALDIAEPGKEFLKRLLTYDTYRNLYDHSLGGFSRKAYKVSVPSPIVYRGNRMVRFNFYIGSRDGVPYIDMTSDKNETVYRPWGDVYPEKYLKAKMIHASLLIGYMQLHLQAQHVKPDMRQGVMLAKRLCRLTLSEPYRSDHFQFQHRNFFEQARSVLRSVQREYFNSFGVDIKSKDARTDRVDFFSEIFTKRVQLLSQSLSKIAEKNNISEDDVLKAIERRNPNYKIDFPDEYLLILSYHLIEFHPEEAKVVRTMKSLE